MDGVSLKPLLLGEDIEDRPLYWHYPHYGNQGGEPSSIIRKGKWKLIYYWEDLHTELYNLESDIGERTDVSKNNAEITKQMESQLLKWLESMNTHYAEVDPEWDEKAREKWLEKQRTRSLEGQENRRKKMLSPNWQPNRDWWGSQVNN